MEKNYMFGVHTVKATNNLEHFETEEPKMGEEVKKPHPAYAQSLAQLSPCCGCLSPSSLCPHTFSRDRACLNKQKVHTVIFLEHGEESNPSSDVVF